MLYLLCFNLNDIDLSITNNTPLSFRGLLIKAKTPLLTGVLRRGAGLLFKTQPQLIHRPGFARPFPFLTSQLPCACSGKDGITELNYPH